MTQAKPWHGGLVAAALRLGEAHTGGPTIGFDAYAELVGRLAAGGCHGVTRLA
jgi:1-pyrroline-4-hydroxy-2-carboxylate deaminase